MAEGDFASILPEMPCILTRKDIPRYLGSYISIRYLANLDSEKKGPIRYKIGRKVVYKKEDFIAWLESRLN